MTGHHPFSKPRAEADLVNRAVVVDPVVFDRIMADAEAPARPMHAAKSRLSRLARERGGKD